jgi:hypothetical protein
MVTFPTGLTQQLDLHNSDFQVSLLALLHLTGELFGSTGTRYVPEEVTERSCGKSDRSRSPPGSESPCGRHNKFWGVLSGSCNAIGARCGVRPAVTWVVPLWIQGLPYKVSSIPCKTPDPCTELGKDS